MPGADPDLEGLETELGPLRAALSRAVAAACPAWLADRRDDLVQESLLRVAAARRREPQRPLSPGYLRRAAHCALIDEIRRQRRRREVPLEDGERQLEPAGAAADPETHSIGAQIGGAIRACLGGLSAPRRQALLLYLQGHSVPEAARLLGWDGTRTRNLVYRGLEELRACLRAKGHAR